MINGHRSSSRPPLRPRAAALLSAVLLLSACGERSEDEQLGARDRAAAVVLARTYGLLHLERDRLDEAETEFRRLAELAPDDGAGPANLAVVALRRGDVEEAERWSREALDRAPRDASSRLVRAKVLEVAGDGRAARTELERVLELDPGNIRALWALAGGSSEERAGVVEDPGRAGFLTRIVDEAPANLAARFELVEALLSQEETEAAARHLEEVRALVARFPDGAEVVFERALERARASDADGARASARALHDRMRLTSAYQSALDDLRGPPGEATGFPTLSFSHEISLEVPDPTAVLAALRFVDATGFAGLGSGGRAPEQAGYEALDPSSAEPVVATGDFDGDGDQDIYTWIPGEPPEGGHRLLRNDLGRFVELTPETLTQPTTVRGARFADYDGDGHLDLYLVREGPDALYRNQGDERFEEVAEESGVAEGDAAPAVDTGAGPTATAILFADLDHDADLDLWVAEDGGVRFHRNRGDGGFTRVPGALGLVDGAGAGFTDAAFADFDDDGDLDVVATRAGARSLWFENLRQDRFRPGPAGEGRADLPSAHAVAVGDYDNDGYTDLAFATADGPVALYRNPGDGDFEPDRRSDDVLATANPARALAFLDFDNDGRLDLALAGFDGAVLLRNRGDGVFEDRSDLLPSDLPPATGVTVFDYNEDGDQDLLLATAAGPRLLRNDGGNANHHFELRLTARGPGSGKVNRFGIGSKVEVRAGDLYQTRTVRGPVTHFGLGSRLKADVVRIVWTNGVPQYIHFPGTEAELFEAQALKGSCAFVYAWDGERYTFVTDAMWRSAIGMPLGILGGGGAEGSERVYAPPGASKEFIRIPGDRLRPRDGRYRLQLTEELWEVAYVDEVKLLAVDHPDSVEIFVDEKFVPPAPPRLQLFTVAERLLPASAVDGAGVDLLPALRRQDARYVADLSVGRYQGVVAPHDVVLELPPEAARSERPFLFLQGWIFPTDASINVATSQAGGVSVAPPRLEVPDGRGGWRTAIPQMGFPAGKEKTVVVDLAGVVRGDDPRIRIRTNIQVYWDHAFFAVGDVAGLSVSGGAAAAAARARTDRAGGGGRSGETRIHLLEPVAADLHHRGFSREYRKGGRHGPHWFDYDDVSGESRWLRIPGRYTRFGDVLPLLEGPDDMYVVMAPGDETTVEFDATAAPAVPDGWTRTFLLYTDGWIKDADLNTARGGTVEPLPFQAQSRYPHAPGEAYPSDAEHRAYLERYQTREVTGGTLGLKR